METVVCPVFPVSRLAPTEEMREAARESVPIERPGWTADIGNAGPFLVAPPGSYVNGVARSVDGDRAQDGAGGTGAALSAFARVTEKQ